MPKRDRPSCSDDDDNHKKHDNNEPSQKQKQTAVVVAKKAPSVIPTRGLTELDDIFAAKKKAKKSVLVTEKEKTQVKGGGVAKATATASHSKSKPIGKGMTSRQDVEGMMPNVWYDDGLGGKINRDGFTGRVEGGVKVFKAHIFNKKDFGQSKDCPFDCNCCFI
jgi:hypothetical protein